MHCEITERQKERPPKKGNSMGKKLGEVDDCFSWPLSLGSHCCLPSLDCRVAVVLGAMQEVISQDEAESNYCITSAINP